MIPVVQVVPGTGIAGAVGIAGKAAGADLGNGNSSKDGSALESGLGFSSVMTAALSESASGAQSGGQKPVQAAIEGAGMTAVRDGVKSPVAADVASGNAKNAEMKIAEVESAKAAATADAGSVSRPRETVAGTVSKAESGNETAFAGETRHAGLHNVVAAKASEAPTQVVATMNRTSEKVVPARLERVAALSANTESVVNDAVNGAVAAPGTAKEPASESEEAKAGELDKAGKTDKTSKTDETDKKTQVKTAEETGQTVARSGLAANSVAFGVVAAAAPVTVENVQAAMASGVQANARGDAGAKMVTAHNAVIRGGTGSKVSATMAVLNGSGGTAATDAGGAANHAVNAEPAASGHSNEVASRVQAGSAVVHGGSTVGSVGMAAATAPDGKSGAAHPGIGQSVGLPAGTGQSGVGPGGLGVTAAHSGTGQSVGLPAGTGQSGVGPGGLGVTAAHTRDAESGAASTGSTPGNGFTATLLQGHPGAGMGVVAAAQAGGSHSAAGASGAGGANPYARMDEPQRATLTYASQQKMAVAVSDPALGSFQVRAQSAGAQVAASLATASAATHAQLSGHLPSLTAFLQDQRVDVTRVTVVQQSLVGGDSGAREFGGQQQQSRSGSGDARAQAGRVGSVESAGLPAGTGAVSGAAALESGAAAVESVGGRTGVFNAGGIGYVDVLA